MARENAKTLQQLRQNPMMAHLLDSLDDGKDIGHYGRLVFAMVAHHFLSDNEVVKHLRQDADVTDADARALLLQVKGRGYSPPKREKIMEWQRQQDFPICPEGENPDGCNIYRDLQFPEEVYAKISEYYEAKAEASN